MRGFVLFVYFQMFILVLPLNYNIIFYFLKINNINLQDLDS